MSQPAPIHARSPCLLSSASALICGRQRLIASRIAPPVHGVSTTRATTPKPRSAPASRPVRTCQVCSGDRSAPLELGSFSTRGGWATSGELMGEPNVDVLLFILAVRGDHAVDRHRRDHQLSGKPARLLCPP